MSQYVVSPPTVVGLPVVGSAQLFPVRRVYCVGRNYAGHAREMGSDPTQEPPFFFCKASDSAAVVPVAAGVTMGLPFPSLTTNYHHEVELVVMIGQGGRNITVAQAMQHVYGYAVGLDMTRRDLQVRMRDQGRPWEIGKAFDYAAPIGPVHPLSQSGELNNGTIQLTVDGQLKQSGDLNEMICSVAEVIAQLSQLFALEAGDVIFTGTPEGVGKVEVGQTLVATVAGLTPLQVRLLPEGSTCAAV